jgi:hypothetical protein
MLYNHVLTPNRPSCWSGEAPTHGIFTATSMHPSVTNVVHADGSVHPTSEAIDLVVWRALGSRSGNP